MESMSAKCAHNGLNLVFAVRNDAFLLHLRLLTELPRHATGRLQELPGPGIWMAKNGIRVDLFKRLFVYPLVNQHNYGKSPFLWENSL